MNAVPRRWLLYAAAAYVGWALVLAVVLVVSR